MIDVSALRIAVELLVIAETNWSWREMDNNTPDYVLESELKTARALYELELLRLENRS